MCPEMGAVSKQSLQHGGPDELDLTGLSGVLGTRQDADKLLGKDLGTNTPANTELLEYLTATEAWAPQSEVNRTPAFAKKLKPALTRWVCPGWLCQNFGAVSVTAGDLYYIPIFVEETTTYIRIGISIGVAATGECRVGIYNWSNGLPGSLVLDAGKVNTGTTGVKQITISQQLTRGYYFLAVLFDATPTPVGISAGWTGTSPVSGMKGGFDEPNLVVLETSGRSGDVAGGLPDPAPAPDGASTYSQVIVLLREN